MNATPGRDPRICRDLPGSESELMRLVNAVCEGTASQLDIVALESLLADPGNRDFYLAAVELHASLLWRWHVDASAPPGCGLAGPSGSPAVGRSASPSPFRPDVRGRFAAAVGMLWRVAVAVTRSLARPVPLSLLVAAAVLGSVIGTAAVVRIRRDAATHTTLAAKRRAAPLATITGMYDVAWAKAATVHRPLDGLVAGDVIEIDRGLVEVSHALGALVLIEGPARYEVRGKAAGRLTGGRVAARTVHPELPAGAEPRPVFTILTPSSVIHDLGTEFGAEVEASSGLAAVHVFEGLVELAGADRATRPDAPFVRLAAGESARMAEMGRIVPASLDLRRRFVRSLPEPASGGRVASAWERIGWNDATAVTIYRDPLRGSGPLARTTPASRGGVGDATWTAPDRGWELTPGGLVVTGDGACAWLPFAPEPGMLYRFTVEMRVVEGVGWLGAGAVAPPRVDSPIQAIGGDAVWFLQRSLTNHDTPNEVFVRRSPQPVDSEVGHLKRALVLDTGTPARVHFYLGDRLLSSKTLGQRPSLTAAALSSMGKCTGTFLGMSLEQSRPTPTANAGTTSGRKTGSP